MSKDILPKCYGIKPVGFHGTINEVITNPETNEKIYRNRTYIEIAMLDEAGNEIPFQRRTQGQEVDYNEPISYDRVIDSVSQDLKTVITDALDKYAGDGGVVKDVTAVDAVADLGKNIKQ